MPSAILRRFIDIDSRLPEAERKPFMDALLQSTGIEDYFKNGPAGSIRGDDYGSVREWLLTFFASSSLSLRRIAQSIHRLGLVFASLRKDTRALATAATIALVMRTLEPDLFWSFTRGEVKDREAAQVMLGRVPGLSDPHSELLEAILIVAALEIEHPDRYARDVEPSPFLAEYRGAARKAKETGDHSDPASLRAMVVADTVDSLMMDQLRGVGLGFREAARRLELLSPSLVDDGQRSDGGRDG